MIPRIERRACWLVQLLWHCDQYLCKWHLVFTISPKIDKRRRVAAGGFFSIIKMISKILLSLLIFSLTIINFTFTLITESCSIFAIWALSLSALSILCYFTFFLWAMFYYFFLFVIVKEYVLLKHYIHMNIIIISFIYPLYSLLQSLLHLFLMSNFLFVSFYSLL